jgi:hypothetical protein
MFKDSHAFCKTCENCQKWKNCFHFKKWINKKMCYLL